MLTPYEPGDYIVRRNPRRRWWTPWRPRTQTFRAAASSTPCPAPPPSPPRQDAP